MILETDGEKFIMHGQGVRRWNNGDVYDGEFKDGLASGEGMFVHSNGDKYTGAFDNDAYNGIGTFKNEEDRIERSGNWVNNELHGVG